MLSEVILSLEDAVLDEEFAKWSKTVSPGSRALCISRFGDWLFEDGATKQVCFLDLLDGSQATVAPSIAALPAVLDSPELRDDLFSTGLLAMLETMGRKLEQGQCFGFAVPPRIGGALDWSNIRASSLASYQTLTSQLHPMIAALPEGASVTGMELDGDTLVLDWHDGP